MTLLQAVLALVLVGLLAVFLPIPGIVIIAAVVLIVVATLAPMLR